MGADPEMTAKLLELESEVTSKKQEIEQLKEQVLLQVTGYTFRESDSAILIFRLSSLWKSILNGKNLLL